MNRLALTNKPFDGTITSLVTNGTVELSGGLYNHGGADLSVEESARTRNLTDFQMIPEDQFEDVLNTWQDEQFISKPAQMAGPPGQTTGAQSDH